MTYIRTIMPLIPFKASQWIDYFAYDLSFLKEVMLDCIDYSYLTQYKPNRFLESVQQSLPSGFHSLISYHHYQNAYLAAVNYTKNFTQKTDILAFEDYPNSLVTKTLPVLSEESIDYVLAIFEQLVSEPNHNIAAFIYEPLVHCNTSGVLIDQTLFNVFLSKLREKNILLIADERFTGLYRLGHLWASATQTIRPDLMCFGHAPAFVAIAESCHRGSMEILTQEHEWISPFDWMTAQSVWEIIGHNTDMIESIHCDHMAFKEKIIQEYPVSNPTVCGSVLTLNLQNYSSDRVKFKETHEVSINHNRLILMPAYNNYALNKQYQSVRMLLNDISEASQNSSQEKCYTL